MKARNIFLLCLLAVVLLATGVLAFLLADDMVRQAVRDALIHAVRQILPWQLLLALCVTAFLVALLMPFMGVLMERIPWLRKKRIAEQSAILRERTEKAEAAIGRAVIARQEAEARAEEAERVAAFAKKASQAVRVEVRSLERAREARAAR